MSHVYRYFNRNNSFTPKIKAGIRHHLKYCIVIPVFNEPELFFCINSLLNAKKTSSIIEVILVFNFPEFAPKEQKETTRKQYHDFNIWNVNRDNDELVFHSMLLEDVPKKQAGPGFARRVGMDEAAYRLHKACNDSGFIVSLDADTLVHESYFEAIETFDNHHQKHTIVGLNFRHRLSNNRDSKQDEAIIQYELHLRYFVEALRYINYPFAVHTIGSAFMVRAEAYCRNGGMASKNAGEDFYFIQKLIQHEKFKELNTTTVFPSSRPSSRVVFGTGPAVAMLMQQHSRAMLSYDLDSVLMLRHFFDNLNQFFSYNTEEALRKMELNNDLLYFLKEQSIVKIIDEVKQNSSNIAAFEKRFFTKFNTFFVIKFLNWFHSEKANKKPVEMELNRLLRLKGIGDSDDIKSADLLYKMREIQSRNEFAVN